MESLPTSRSIVILDNNSRFQNEQALVQVLEMQRQRIDELEKENDGLNKKYEKLLFQQKTFNQYNQPLSVSLAG